MAKKTLKIGMFYYSDPDIFPAVTNPARVLARAGYQVDIITYYRGKDWAVDYGPGIRLIRLNEPGMDFPRSTVGKLKGLYDFGYRSVEIAKNEHYDIAYGHDMHGFWAAHRVGRALRIPVIYHCHDLAQLDRTGRLDYWIKRWEMRYSKNAVLVVLPEARRARIMREQNRLTREPIIVWNCPLRGPRPKTDLFRQLLREQVGERAKFVIRHGTLGPGHCIEETIRSMSDWPEEVHFVLIGYGTDDNAQGHKWPSVQYRGRSNSQYVHNLESLAEQIGYRSRLHLLPSVSYEDIFDCIAGAHLGHAIYQPTDDINGQYLSTASLKFFEYMRAGLPIIASNEEGFKRLIDEFDCGVCADPNNPESIGKAVHELFSDESLRQKLGENAYRAHIEKCNYETQYQPVLKLLEQLF